MAYIYTIAHPITNYIVYVGCTENLEKRSTAHSSSKNLTPIANWIQDLKSNYMLPKVELIDTCDFDSALSLEEYWIHQLKSWGFDLLNRNKLPSVKLKTLPYQRVIIERRKTKKIPRYIKKTPEQWAEQRRLRNEASEFRIAQRLANKKYKWNLLSFEIGKIYDIPKDNRNSFRAMFGIYAKKFEVSRHLERIEHNGNFAYIVMDGSRVFNPSYGVTKSGKKRYYRLLEKKIKEPKILKLQRYNLNAANPGDSIFIKKDKFRSFMTVQAFHNRNSEHKVYYNYEILESQIKINFVNKSEETKISKLSSDTVISVYNSTGKIREIAEFHNILQSVVWSIRNGKSYKYITNHNQQP